MKQRSMSLKHYVVQVLSDLGTFDNAKLRFSTFFIMHNSFSRICYSTIVSYALAVQLI